MVASLARSNRTEELTMARINTIELISLVSETAYRADQVRHDPLVAIAAKRFAQDARSTATSACLLATSIANSWALASAGRPPLAPRTV
jgi:hypothetical protein